MKTDIITGVSLVALGVVLTVLSVPYLAENVTLGALGVVGGILMILSAIKPFLAARAHHRQPRP